MDALPFIAPAWGDMEAWNRAFDKVEDFLRAHRVDSRLQRTILIQRVLANVAMQPPPEKLDPGTVEVMAIVECRRMMHAWAGRLLNEPDAVFADGDDWRIAMLLADTAIRWPYTFMEEKLALADMRAALKRSVLRAGPDLAVSHMVPRAMKMGLLPDMASGAITALARWPIVRFMLIWGLYLLILTALFFWTRR